MPERFLCIASYEKGQDFLRQCAALGVKPTLLTVDKLRDADWPRDVLDDLATMPESLSREQILNTVSWMARGKRFDRIVALDEFDQETAALVREHMRLPGMNVSTANCYRDKLAMRTTARKAGFLVPEFCRDLLLRRPARDHGSRAATLAAEAPRRGLGARHPHNSRAGAVVACPGRAGRRAKPFSS